MSLVGLQDTMASREVKALAEFYEMLSNSPARAFYGPGHVAAAAELGAIQTLLISDSVFRVNDVEKRRKVTRLVEGGCRGRGRDRAWFHFVIEKGEDEGEGF